MRLALLGADDESVELVRQALRDGHELVAAYDSGPQASLLRALASGASLSEDWEALLTGQRADGVIVGRGGADGGSGLPPAARRADQLRKLAQAALPLLVVCPACEAIVGFEIEMIRRDVGGTIVPYVPGLRHPALEALAALLPTEGLSPIGAVEQIWFERQAADRGRPAVLTQLARDVALLRRLMGPLSSVSATGPTAGVGRDPLGPRPRELPSLANLNVHLGGETGRSAHWTIGPLLAQPQGQITVVGQHGRALLLMPASGAWSLTITGHDRRQETYPHDHTFANALEQLAHAHAAAPAADSGAWLNACRDQEAAEAVDRSLLRGRTIELYNEEHTEAESFKGVMAMGGCLLLVAALALVLLAALVEGLQLPLRNWPLWRLWPVLLVAPLGGFLLLQLLQLVIRREPASAPQPAGGPEK